jgi:hypothetical protein
MWFFAWAILRTRVETVGLLVVLAFYTLTRVVPALWLGDPVEDVFQAFRWLFYLAVMAVAVGKSWQRVDQLVLITWVLIALATIKAALTYIVLGPGERPGLLVENNFELALFSGLLAVVYPVMRHRALAIGLLGVLVVLAGSRSGSIAFLMLMLYAAYMTRKAGVFTRYLQVVALPLLALVPVIIFTSRSTGGVESIDRVRFLEVFLHDASDWNPFIWLFGNVPITAISPEGCGALSFYAGLFSSDGDGTCYSVILHAFVMRVIFDAGLVGLAISIAIPWWLMRKTGNSIAITLCLSAIAFTNGLSVSGLNNPYVALPFVLAILVPTRVRGSGDPGAIAEDFTVKPRGLSKLLYASKG